MEARLRLDVQLLFHLGDFLPVRICVLIIRTTGLRVRLRLRCLNLKNPRTNVFLLSCRQTSRSPIPPGTPTGTRTSHGSFQSTSDLPRNSRNSSSPFPSSSCP